MTEPSIPWASAIRKQIRAALKNGLVQYTSITESQQALRLIQSWNLESKDSLFDLTERLGFSNLHGAKQWRVVHALRKKGDQLNSQGLYSMAMSLFTIALEISQANQDPPPVVAGFLYDNIGYTCSRLGLINESIKNLELALAIKESHFGENHRFVATTLISLSRLLMQKGDYQRSDHLCDRALKIREAAFGFNSGYLVTCLNTKAMLCLFQGNVEEGQAFVCQALEIAKGFSGTRALQVATIQNISGWLAIHGEDYARALQAFLAALTIRENNLGRNHPLTFLCRLNYAICLYKLDRVDEALVALEEVLLHEISFLQRELPLLPMGYRSQVVGEAGASQLIAEVSLGYPQARRLSMLSRINRHGLLWEIERYQFQLASCSTPAVQSTLNQIKAIAAELSSGSTSSDERCRLSAQKTSLEASIYKHMPVFQAEVVEPVQLAKIMADDAVLLEFQKIYKWNGFCTRREPRWEAPLYVCYVLTSDGRIDLVRLGDALIIEELVSSALQASEQLLLDSQELWRALSERLLLPLIDHICDKNEIFVTLDGQLHLLPLAAIPNPLDTKKPLSDSFRIRILTTSRDLIRQSHSTRTPTALGTPIVMADPDFYYSNATSDKGDQSVLQSLADRSVLLEERHQADWQPLPNSMKEGSAVASLLGCVPITGAEASARRLKQAASPLIVHVASHGFFKPDQACSAGSSIDQSLSEDLFLSAEEVEQSMLRSGLVLAGANSSSLDSSDNGFLTALEATHLNLQGTEMVVLSACDTGRGDIQTGEGLYGLQRALIVAGAKSTLLSLWKVPDEATYVFMQRFYSLLKEGFGRSDALVAVQGEFRQHENEDWHHPYYWAAWQLVGDWRPINGL